MRDAQGRHKRRETARDRQLRKEMELLGMMVWMAEEADLVSAAVTRTGEQWRKMLMILAGKEEEKAAPGERGGRA